MASGTDFVRKYQNDIFLQTETNIISLQVAYAAVILFFSIGAILTLAHEAVQTVVTLAAMIIVATVVFGYLVAQRALAPARSALASQKEFIGNVAHELRTPLAIIKANTEILLLEKRGDPTVRETHRSNIEELNRISDIINNLLTLNVLIQPEQISFEHVEFGNIIKSVVQALPRPSREQPVRVKVRVAADCVVWGNRAALEQIATNIINNALEHTARGEIVVTASCDRTGVFEFSVRDTGSGIAQEHLFRIFEPFYRGDRARTRNATAGSGLGLTIVSELVKLHKGRVSIKSALGQGTTVTVTLPCGARKPSPPKRAGLPMSEVFADFWHGKQP